MSSFLFVMGLGLIASGYMAESFLAGLALVVVGVCFIVLSVIS